MNMKRFVSLLLVLPLVTFCGNKNNPDPKPEPTPDPQPEVTPKIEIQGAAELSVACEAGSGTISFISNQDWTAAADDDWLTVTPTSGKASEQAATVTYSYPQNPKMKKRTSYVVISAKGIEKRISLAQAADMMAGAAPEVKSGDVVASTNPLAAAFIEGVSYPDKTSSEYTEIFNYPGGFNGKDLTWDNWETDWPDGDMPLKYSIRWKEEDMDKTDMTLVLSDELGWSGELEIPAGSRYVNITNLVPNDKYTYKVTSTADKVVAQGNFSTTGCFLHQVYFLGDPSKANMKGGGGRNARDFGGWKTEDGKTIKYRKVYRGGRLNEKWKPYPLNAQGEKEVLFEGIGAELDLRGNSDVMFEPAVEGLEHCAPVIEQGGKTMLVSDHAKTKECFEFVVNCVRENKPIYFHCSLGRDRTGTLGILLLGILGVREGDISKEYELTYFAPVGYSVSSSDKKSNPIPTYQNTRRTWVYSDVVPYLWELAGEGTFAQGVEKYLLEVAGVAQKDIDDFRELMLE